LAPPSPPWDEEIAAETSRVTYDIDEDDNELTRHELEFAPATAAQVTGWRRSTRAAGT
jgi:hypothetical protein